MNMRSEKRSLALLSSKRTKAYTRTIADETFSLPSFPDTMPPFSINGVPQKSMKVPSNMDHEHDNKVVKLKQRMLEHETVFKEQLFELHRLYHVQRSLMSELKTMNPTQCSVPSHDATSSHHPGSLKRKGEQMLWDVWNGGNLGQKASVLSIENYSTQSCQFKRRPVIDLEQPAAEDMDFEPAKEPHGFLEATKVSSNYTDLNCAARENMNDMYRGIIHSDEDSSGKVQNKGNGEIHFFNIDDGRRSAEGASKLPHWLLEPSTTTKAVVQPSIVTQQPLPLFIQKHEETKIFGERILSNSREVSCPSYSSSSLAMSSRQGESPLKESLARHISSETPTAAYDFPSKKRNFPAWLQNDRSVKNDSFPFLSNGKERKKDVHTPSMSTSSSYPLPQSSASSTQPIVGIQTQANGNAPMSKVIRHMAFPEVPAGVPNSPLTASVYQQNLFPTVTSGQVSQPILAFNQNAFHLSDTNFLRTQNCNLERPSTHDDFVKGRCELWKEEGNDFDRQYKFLEISRPEMTPLKTAWESTFSGSNIAPGLCHSRVNAADEPKSIRHNLDLNAEICEDLSESNSNTETVGIAICKEPMDEQAVLLPSQQRGSLHRSYASPSISYMNPNCFRDENSRREHAPSEIVKVRSTMEKDDNQDRRRNRKLCSGINRCGDSVAVDSCGSSVLTRFESRETITTPPLSLAKVHGKLKGSSEEVWACQRALSSTIQPQRDSLTGDFSTNCITSLPIRSPWDDLEIVAGVLLSFWNDYPKSEAHNADSEDGKQGRSLEQLADAISEVESNEETVRIDSADGDTQMPLQLDEALVKSHDKTLDWFELAILRLKPMNPEAERLCENVTEGGDSVREESPPPVVAPVSNSRRRSPRRGKVSKDFQKDVLSSIVSLSRHEIAEDLQMVEGLIESTMTSTGRRSPSKGGDEGEKCLVVSEQGSAPKQTGKTQTSKSCKNKKSTLILRFCTWGETTRRKRMRRRRSHCPSVIKSLLS